LNPAFWLTVLSLMHREIIRFWREKGRVLGFVGSPLIFWLVIGSGFGNLRFFFPGALALTVMFSAVFSTMSLIEDRREGFLLSMLVSPAPRSAVVYGKVLGSATLAWLQGLIFLAFAPLAGARPSVGEILLLAVAIYVMSFTFTALGFLIAWRMDSTQGYHAIINLLLLPLWMVSGALFPMEGAHGWMRVVMRLNPVTYALAPIQRLLDGRVTAETPPLALSLLITAGTGLVLWIASAILVNRPSARNAG
jgi:ABC-2 type transport system permease protein